jgi:GR25 family glycosyltransferase involved in LPS biosynthesis
MALNVSLKVYIINVSEYRDAFKLVESLNSIGLYNIEVVNAITPKNLPCRFELSDHVHRSKVRQLSCREVAVSISHQIIKEKIVSDGAQWALILEDDAILIDNPKNLIIFESLASQTSSPAIISLFAEQYGIFYPSKEDFIYKTIKKPDYAIAYLINLKACVFFLEHSNVIHTHFADWPSFIPNKMFKAVFPSIFVHPAQLNESAVQKERSIAALKKMTYRSIIRRRFFRIVFEMFSLIGKKEGDSKIDSDKLRSSVLRGVRND